jgi:uncharacterized protein (DUF983 family)
MAEHNAFTSCIKGKCPRCGQSAIFKYPAYHITKFNVMNRSCGHCGVLFEPEPGFYQGAMYISYAFTVAILVTLSVIFFTFFSEKSESFYIAVFLGIMVLFIPINYRLSRNVYLYLFGGLRK